MYKLVLSRRDKKRLLAAKGLLIFTAVIGLGLVAWLAWVRPEIGPRIASFEECQAAGHPIQASYPEVCLASDGKRFVNQQQQAAHQVSLSNMEELVPPTNPDLLYLAVDEWNVGVPLTTATFDLIYTYLEDGFSERLAFNFKRLVNAGYCPGDVGVSLTRSPLQHQPPFTVDNPAASAHIGNYYFYTAVAGSPCYDPENAEQAALVKEITGDQSLTQTVTQLLNQLQPQSQ